MLVKRCRLKVTALSYIISIESQAIYRNQKLRRRRVVIAARHLSQDAKQVLDCLMAHTCGNKIPKHQSLRHIRQEWQCASEGYMEAFSCGFAQEPSSLTDGGFPDVNKYLELHDVPKLLRPWSQSSLAVP